MKKLTAGIFAGILTIVTVNAADAAITSKAYVDDLVGKNTTAITELKGTVAGHTTDIADLKTTVENLSGDGTGSVADQIAGALGDLGDDTTVKAELDKKQDKSTAAYSMGNAAGEWTALTTDELGALQSGITSADVTQITTNKNDITKINTTIGEIADGKTVAGLIEEAKTSVSGDVDNKIGEIEGTVADALDEKQDVLGATNVTTTGDGNAIVSISAEDGKITATKGAVIPEIKTTGQTGTYVLTATISDTGIDYMWESIERAAPAETEE